MENYLKVVNTVLKEGNRKSNRTGFDTVSLAGTMFEHEMRDGFPLLTTKRMPFRLVASELEFFIHGYTDKQWLTDKGNHIWDDWCRPDFVPYSNDEATKTKMRNERDLGPIYGWQWRNFGAEYRTYSDPRPENGIDQLALVLARLREDPSDRRMVVTAWNPSDLGKMALPPCHFAFELTVTNRTLNLMWFQRSVDVALGLPFNIASYGLLLHLIARDSGLEEGRLVGFLGDTHIYLNHIDGLKQQLGREAYKLPTIETRSSRSTLEWTHDKTVLSNYQCHPAIKFGIAV